VHFTVHFIWGFVMAVVDVAVQSDKRNAVSCEQLEFEIGKAVRKFKAGCKDFAGVIIERVEPNSPATANWAIKGVRFGRADRDKAAKVLPTVIERMQREFTLAENGAATAQTPGQSVIHTDRLPRAPQKPRRVRSGKPLKAIDKIPQIPEMGQSCVEALPKTPESARIVP
jgi:hypothetical protein